MRGERGQAMVELAVALPFFLVVLLSAVQLAEILAARLATGWAARLAARAAAVHVDADPGRAAAKAAVRVLAPFLPRLPGVAAIDDGFAAYLATAMVYEQGFVATPVQMQIGFVFAGGTIPSAAAARKRIESGEGAAVEARVTFDMPLRIPMASRFFSNGKEGIRRLVAVARFPVMYAPMKEER